MLSPLIAAELRKLQARIARNTPNITTQNSDARLGSAVVIKRANQRAVLPFDNNKQSRRQVGRFR